MGGDESSSESADNNSQLGGDESSLESDDNNSQLGGDEVNKEQPMDGGDSSSNSSSLPSYINNAMKDILEDKYSKDQVSHNSGISIKDLLKNKMNM